MQWHSHYNLTELAKRCREMDDSDLDRVLAAIPDQGNREILYGAWLWMKCRRPYYNLFPCIVDSIAKTKLDIPIKPLISALRKLPPCLCLRSAVGRAPVYDGHEFRSAAIFAHPGISEHTGTPTVVVSINCETEERDGITPVYSWASFDVRNETFQAGLADLMTPEGATAIDKGIMTFALRAYVFLALCISNPDIVQPVVLTSDSRKYDISKDPKFIEKAIRRGVHQYNVGERFETIPHFRRPHFGIRWTETGGSVPKLVPIQGAIVNRKALTDVPTGYVDDDDNDNKS